MPAEIVFERRHPLFTQFYRQLVAHYDNLGPGTVVDVHSDMRRLTLEAVTQASFSLPLGLLSEKKDDVIQITHTR